MSGVRITDLVSTTNLGNGDYIATDNDEQGTRKIGYSNLSNKVLDKLPEKQFTNLATAQKKILDAINELNTRIGNIITPSGQASLSELIDVRTNFLGQKFATAGDAVRVSDMLTRGYTYAPFTYKADWAGDRDSSVWNTASVNVSQYKGGQVCAFLNAHYDSESIRSGSPLLYAGNTADPDTNAVELATPDYYYDIKQYTSPLGGYRIGIIVNIPDNFSYTYLYCIYAPLYEAYQYDPGIMTPDFISYGVKGTALTYSDPDNDGNIIIS